MKKFLKKAICLLISIIMMFCVSINVYAGENNESDSLYIYSKQCPNDIIEYATSNFMNFIDLNDVTFETDTISLSTPFTFANTDSDIYYFPIIDGDNIAGLFRVFYDDNTIAGIYSSFLCNELEKYIHSTSSNNPLKLYMKDNGIYSVINNTETCIYEYPENIDFSNAETVNTCTTNSDNSNYVIIDILNNLLGSANVSISLCDSVSNYITLNRPGTQGANNWCGAFSAAAIMRTRGYNTSCTARTVMTAIYGTGNFTTNTSLTANQVRNYARNNNINAIVTSSFNGNMGVREIDANRPVWFGMTSSSGGHAIVLRGYNASSGIYSIWNPWYDYYEYYTMGGTYVPAAHSSFKFKLNEAIYNWTR